MTTENYGAKVPIKLCILFVLRKLNKIMEDLSALGAYVMENNSALIKRHQVNYIRIFKLLT